MTTPNALAKHFRSLHVPGRPLVLANVYDILSAEAVAQLPSCKALATASYAIAHAAGSTDDEMTMETNLSAVRGIVKVAQKYGKPLSVDFQDGYGEMLEEGVVELIGLGVSGVNLEDCDKDTMRLFAPEVAVQRIRKVLEVAEREGVPDFVVNARSDAFLRGGELSEAISRGKLYLEAGATTVFVLGWTRELSKADMVELVKEFDGRLALSLKLASGPTVKELAEIGVARISVGPQLQVTAMNHLGQEAERFLSQAR